MHKIPKIFWLLGPALVFLILVTLIISLLPKTDGGLSTSIEGIEVPTSAPEPTSIPVPVSQIDQLINKITIYDPQDPVLVAPNFDMHISLPE
jgi:hypothetical protein